MKKKLLTTLIMAVLILSSSFASGLIPLQASSKNGSHQVIGNLFYIATMNSDISASSVGIGASYHNKLSEKMGIYANGGVGKAFAFKFSGNSGLTNTVVVSIQSGPYYKIELPYENMSVKVGGGLDLSMYGGKLPISGKEAVAISVGAGAFGSFEYEIAEMITLIGTLNVGVDFITWKTNVTNYDLEKANIGPIINVSPSIGVSYTL